MAKLNRTYLLDTESVKKLEELAARAERSLSAQLRWLINNEHHRCFGGNSHPTPDNKEEVLCTQ